jgi:hypothetical protein
VTVADDDLVDRLARAIHECYLREQGADGVAMGSRPAMVAWDRLSQDLRDANRAQARAIGAKLAAVGCGLAASTVDVDPFRFTDAEVEALARQEQVRWYTERRAAGWRYGHVRDDGTKLHPDLVSWDQLSEDDRDKDRDAVRNLPHVLASVGLMIVRSRP